jgi:hypothetical protein
MTKLLRALALTTGVICAAIGIYHFAGGIASVPGESHTNATVDSRERFYAAIFFGYGLLWIWTARQSPFAVTTAKWLSGIFLLGGFGRLLSMTVQGRPHEFQIVLTVVELVLPVVLLWLCHVHGRRKPTDSRPVENVAP